MILSELMDALVELIYGIFYKLFSCICVLIDFIKEIFYKLCGIETVKIDGEDTDLLSNLMTSDIIKRVFLTVFLIGVILLVIFTIIAIIKSNYQEKQNWKTVLSKTAQSLVISILIPFTVLAGIVLTLSLIHIYLFSLHKRFRTDANSENAHRARHGLAYRMEEKARREVSTRKV